ncbi:hypothetical protein MPTK1_1g24110 [Marchantia polymorpha subsp. ruderalis]|uniref:Uncharacterized protein n=2 Tax=Marchantia polymorpha TaxID=3197 RepID=A0AAF6ATQ2_MARPO|nr:hypothetical protein MARPO_0061s0110 [Marchantia polymorpha]BBM99822.1 hypothetical protein Mp_1g24110 [Marchantia polymorpha subsp. ruderalis]|eukprot:PTQ36863.1 hypothetical protein MARPO_0061s0110 [Marchantia polymorpha]
MIGHVRAFSRSGACLQIGRPNDHETPAPFPVPKNSRACGLCLPRSLARLAIAPASHGPGTASGGCSPNPSPSPCVGSASSTTDSLRRHPAPRARPSSLPLISLPPLSKILVIKHTVTNPRYLYSRMDRMQPFRTLGLGLGLPLAPRPTSPKPSPAWPGPSRPGLGLLASSGGSCMYPPRRVPGLG